MRIILVLFGLAYLISPADLIPDLLLPWLGWLDDGAVLWCVYHLIRYGELPWFLSRKPGSKGFSSASPGRKSRQSPDGSASRPTPGARTAGSSGRVNSGTRSTSGKNHVSGAAPSAAAPSPYEILGISPDASWEVIQKAYKEKIKQYHPDKLSHLGEEFSSLANEKFLEIQKAYNTLKQKHG